MYPSFDIKAFRNCVESQSNATGSQRERTAGRRWGESERRGGLCETTLWRATGHGPDTVSRCVMGVFRQFGILPAPKGEDLG